MYWIEFEHADVLFAASVALMLKSVVELGFTETGIPAPQRLGVAGRADAAIGAVGRLKGQ